MTISNPLAPRVVKEATMPAIFVKIAEEEQDALLNVLAIRQRYLRERAND